MRGTVWHVQTLIRMLDGGFGAGLLVTERRSGKDVHLPGAHEPVITVEEWEGYKAARARRRMEPPKRRTARWHLTGVAVCGLCGSRLNVSTHHEGKALAACSRYKSSRNCTGVWMSRYNLEREVAMWLGGRIDQLAAELPTRDAERLGAQRSRNEAQGSLEATVRALGQLAADRARGLLDDDGYRGAQAVLLADRDAAESAVAEAREEVARLAPPEDMYAALEQTPEMTPGEFATLVGRVLRRVEVTKELLRFVPVVGEPEEFPR